MVNGPPPPDGPWRRGSPPAPDILWNLFISFSPPHTKSFYISTFLHLKSSWSRCFFFAKIYDLGKVPTKCRPFGRCFGVNLFEIFCENLRYFEISTNGRKYCRCRMGDHQVRVFAHHWVWLPGSGSAFEPLRIHNTAWSTLISEGSGGALWRVWCWIVTSGVGVCCDKCDVE
jgi:hypothetical protein